MDRLPMNPQIEGCGENNNNNLAQAAILFSPVADIGDLVLSVSPLISLYSYGTVVASYNVIKTYSWSSLRLARAVVTP